MDGFAQAQKGKMMSDLISRQAAIDALEETKQSDPFNRYEYQNIGIDWSIDAIKALPSAQPYTDKEIQRMQDLEQVQLDKAFELGKQDAQPEPCEDTVSREMIMRHYDSGEYKHINHISRNGLLDYIEQLPSAQPEPQWIPCSERLPAYGEDVLISICGCCNVGHIVPVNEEEQYNWYFSGWYHLPNDVDAWMPLPEPWRGANS